MPQLGLLYVLLVMFSDSNTQLESLLPWLKTVLQVSPTVDFVAFAQAILYRRVGIVVVRQRLAVSPS
jgi:ABC-2 type transport system permease protein